MIYHQAKNPSDYQYIFYRQIGLEKQEEPGNSWFHKEIGSIYTFGRMDAIQFGIGEYTIPVDFLAEFQYDTEYLHAGIIYEGITYSLADDRMTELAIPSAFLAMEQANGGINCWKKGQHFKGVEISIEMQYLRRVLLPFLGLGADALVFLEKNVRHLQLPAELQGLILQAEVLLQERKMNEELLKAFAVMFLAQLTRGEIRQMFQNGDAVIGGKLQIGKRQISVSQTELRKIIAAHDLLRDRADSFVTIYELSQELEIGEQKLKAGFQKLYQQTIWDYANQVRMRKAADLLKNTEKSIEEISKLTGYQSQAAFRTMFKKWSGTTPGRFRSYMHDSI